MSTNSRKKRRATKRKTSVEEAEDGWASARDTYLQFLKKADPAGWEEEMKKQPPKLPPIQRPRRK